VTRRTVKKGEQRAILLGVRRRFPKELKVPGTTGIYRSKDFRGVYYVRITAGRTPRPKGLMGSPKRPVRATVDMVWELWGFSKKEVVEWAAAKKKEISEAIKRDPNYLRERVMAAAAVQARRGPWWTAVLGLEGPINEEKIRKAYRRKAFVNHPDRGGDPETMIVIAAAYQEAMAAAGAIEGSK
jgi:hypothetical protein